MTIDSDVGIKIRKGNTLHFSSPEETRRAQKISMRRHGELCISASYSYHVNSHKNLRIPFKDLEPKIFTCDQQKLVNLQVFPVVKSRCDTDPTGIRCVRKLEIPNCLKILIPLLYLFLVPCEPPANLSYVITGETTIRLYWLDRLDTNNCTNDIRRVYFFYTEVSKLHDGITDWKIEGTNHSSSEMEISNLETAVLYEGYLLYSFKGIGNGIPSKKITFKTHFNR